MTKGLSGRERERGMGEGGEGAREGRINGKEGGREDRRKEVGEKERVRGGGMEEGRRREGKKGRRAGGRAGGREGVSGGRTERECKEVRGLELEGLRKTICGCKQIWM